MYALNYYTPLFADDYDYSFLWNDDSQFVRLQNQTDVFQSLKCVYFSLSGRMTAHFWVQSFLLAGKPVFNVCNALCYVLFTLLVYFHINTWRKINLSLYIGINLACWFFTPTFGETCLWLTGSCNYLWNMTFILLFLLPFRLLASSSRFRMNGLQTILFSILSLLAGCSNENTGGAMLLAAILFLTYFRHEKIRIPTWAIAGLAMATAGYLILMLGPGNSARIDSYKSYEFSLFTNFVLITKNFYYLLYPLAVLAILCLILIMSKTKCSFWRCFSGILYTVAALAAAYCMALNPAGFVAFPARAWFGIVTFVYIALGIIYVNLPDYRLMWRLTRVSILLAAVPFCVSYKFALADARCVSSFVNERITNIYEQQKQGLLYIETEHLLAVDTHNPRYAVDDINWETDYFSNKSISRYYGIDSIKAVKEHQYTMKRMRY
jgi:hypothetical protein